MTQWANFFNPVGTWGVRGEVERPPPLVDKQDAWRDREIERRGARIVELLALIEVQDKARLEAVDMVSKARFDLTVEQKARSEAIVTIQRLKAEMIERGRQFDAMWERQESFRQQLVDRGKEIKRLKAANARLRKKLG